MIVVEPEARWASCSIFSESRPKTSSMVSTGAGLDQFMLVLGGLR